MLHLRERNLNTVSRFEYSIYHLCNYGYEVETAVHFFLYCPLFANEISPLFNTLRNLDSKLFENTDSLLTNSLLFCKESLYTNQKFLMQL